MNRFSSEEEYLESLRQEAEIDRSRAREAEEAEAQWIAEEMERDMREEEQANGK